MADFDPVTYRESKGAPPLGDPTAGFDPVAYRASKINSPDNPASAEMIPTWENQVEMGFASPDVRNSYLEHQGYKNPQQNKAGDVVAQAPSGRWTKQADNFFPTNTGTPGNGIFPRIQEAAMSAHPGNWLASHVGASLPAMGQMGGEAAAALMAPVTEGASLPFASALGGVGAAGMEGVRQGIGRLMGVNTSAPLSKENLASMGEQGAMGTLAAPISRGVGAAWKYGVQNAPKVIAAVPGLSALTGGAKNLATKIISGMTGAEPESAMQLLTSPTDVIRARAMPIAESADRDVVNTIGERGRAVGNAQEALINAEGGIPKNSTAAKQQIENQLGEGVTKGTISDDEADQIRSVVYPHLQTLHTTPGAGLHTPVEPGMVSTGEYGELTPGFKQTGPEQFTQPPTSSMTPTTDVENLLQGIGKTSPGTENMPKTGFKGAPISGTSDKYLDQLERASGALRGLLTSSGSPEAQALSAANASYGAGKTAAGVIKPLENAPTMENFIRGLSGQGKSAQLGALQELVTPETMNSIRNLIAQKQLQAGKIGSGLLMGASANRAMSPLGGAAVRAVSPWSLMNNQEGAR